MSVNITTHVQIKPVTSVFLLVLFGTVFGMLCSAYTSVNASKDDDNSTYDSKGISIAIGLFFIGILVLMYIRAGMTISNTGGVLETIGNLPSTLVPVSVGIFFGVLMYFSFYLESKTNYKVVMVLFSLVLIPLCLALSSADTQGTLFKIGSWTIILILIVNIVLMGMLEPDVKDSPAKKPVVDLYVSTFSIMIGIVVLFIIYQIWSLKSGSKKPVTDANNREQGIAMGQSHPDN
jgi:hypothetical protein